MGTEKRHDLKVPISTYINENGQSLAQNGVDRSPPKDEPVPLSCRGDKPRIFCVLSATYPVKDICSAVNYNI